MKGWDADTVSVSIPYTMRIPQADRQPLLKKTAWWLISMLLTGGEYQE